MILLDTHIWVWWVAQPDKIQPAHRDLLELGADRVFGISAAWIENALACPGISLLQLTPQIVIESTQLPQPFHRDSADQLLVATARVLQCPIMTEDSKISLYPHVRLA